MLWFTLIGPRHVIIKLSRVPKYRCDPILDEFKFLLEGTVDIQNMDEQAVRAKLGTQGPRQQTDHAYKQIASGFRSQSQRILNHGWIQGQPWMVNAPDNVNSADKR
jgi:hypothetical protein